jgi:hypothetical protein
MFWAILTTIAFALAALAMLINRQAKLATRLMTFMLGLFAVLDSARDRSPTSAFQLVRVRADFAGYRGCLDGRRSTLSVISQRLHAADRNHFDVWSAMRTHSAVARLVPVCP